MKRRKFLGAISSGITASLISPLAVALPAVPVSVMTFTDAQKKEIADLINPIPFMGRGYTSITFYDEFGF